MIKNDIELNEELFEKATDNFRDSETINRPSISYWADVWRRLKQNKLAMCGLGLIGLLAFFAAFGPYLNGFTYYEQDFAKMNLWPNAKHWFGTDAAGRDIFTRAWYGARISLFIGLMAALVDFIFGVIYGGISGFKGGKIDTVMMRIGEVLYSIPYLLMVILFAVTFGAGLFSMVVAMTITGWIPMARLIRGQVMQLKENEYVQASKSFGAGVSWILRKHLVPNTMGNILVNVTLTVPQAIFAEATLSFLGLGIKAPMASWGTMASDALESLLVGRTYQLFIPAFLISLTMFAFNVFGDGLRDALDPKLRK